MLIKKYIFIVLISLFLGACARYSQSKVAFDKDNANKLLAEKKGSVASFDDSKKIFPNATNLPSSADVATREWSPAKVEKIDYGVYAVENRQSGLQGKVIVNLLISEAGEVIDSNIAESTNVFLDQSALLSVKSWKFSPAMLDGKPCQFAVRAPIEFKLIGAADRFNSTLSLDPKIYEQLRSKQELGSTLLLKK